jgi:hypothetical protein
LILDVHLIRPERIAFVGVARVLCRVVDAFALHNAPGQVLPQSP